MNRGLLLLLDHPDDFALRLEEELVGPGLMDVVRDLETVRGPGPAGELSPALHERIVGGGLAGLSEAELQAVLDRPRVLLELQKDVLLGGSVYWDAVVRRIDAPTVPAIPAPARERPNRRSWLTHLATATAAAALVASLFGWRLSQVTTELDATRATAAHLRTELAAHPPIVPADLPGEMVPVSLPDPPDLPGGDPLDLPESPKWHPAGV